LLILKYLFIKYDLI